MKRIIYKTEIVMLFMALMLCFSCSESLLDTEPRGVLTSANFYKTDADARQAVLGAYNLLKAVNSGMFQTTWTLKTLPGDEVIAGGGGRGDQPQLEEINEMNYGANARVLSFVFDQTYQGINRCNIVLANVAGDTPEKTIVRAEAKCLRALLYFDLVTMWGEVPLVLKELAPSEYQQKPAKVADIWAQIETDLTEAANDLPPKSSLATAEKYRVTKGTAQALLGKSYLFEMKYTEAATIFETLISSGEYSLCPDYSRILHHDQEFGVESVFEVSYGTTGEYTWGNYQWGNGKAMIGNIYWQFCGPRAGSFGDLDKIGMWPGWGGSYPTNKIFNAYIAENDSVRRVASIMSEAEFTSKGVSFIIPKNTIYGYCGYIRLKYGTYLDESQAPVNELNCGTNLRLIRYADVLLMAAEANILKSTKDYSKARTYINMVRTRALLPNASEADADLMQRVIKERRLELSFEGTRFPDLVRWNKAGIISDAELASIMNSTMSVIPHRVAFDKHYVLYPIPEQELKTNPNMKQNY